MRPCWRRGMAVSEQARGVGKRPQSWTIAACKRGLRLFWGEPTAVAGRPKFDPRVIGCTESENQRSHHPRLGRQGQQSEVGEGDGHPGSGRGAG